MERSALAICGGEVMDMRKLIGATVVGAALVGAALVIVGVLPARGKGSKEGLMDFLIGEKTAVFEEESLAPFDSRWRRTGGLRLGGIAREQIDLQAGTRYGWSGSVTSPARTST